MATFRNVRTFALAAGLGAAAFASSYEAMAQRVGADAVTLWVDGFLGELRRVGASTASRGAVTFDAATGRFSVADIVVEPPTANRWRLTISRIEGTGAQIAAGGRFRAEQLAVVGTVFAGPEFRSGLERLVFSGVDVPAIGPALDGAAWGQMIDQATVARIGLTDLSFRGGRGQDAFELTQRPSAIEGVGNGRIARIAFGEMAIAARSDGNPPLAARIGALTFEALDLAAYRAMIVAPGALVGQTRVGLARSTFAGAEVDIGRDMRLTVGPMVSEGVRVKIPRVALAEFIGELVEMNNSQPPVPGSPQMRRFAQTMIEWLDVGEVDRTTIGAIEFRGPDAQFRLGGIEVRNSGGARAALIAINGVTTETGPYRGAVDRLSITDLDYTAFMQAMLGEMAAGRVEPRPQALEGRLPRVGGIEMTGFMLNTPETAGEVRLQQFAFAMGRWVGYVPDLLRLNVSGFQLPTALLRDVRSPTPADLGYQRFDLQAQKQFRLDEQARTAALVPARLSIADFGGAGVEVALAGVDSRLLGFDGLTNLPRLLQQVQVQRLALRMENAGFIERFMRWSEQNNRVTPDQMRWQLQMGLSPLSEAIIQDPQQQARAREAIRTFVAQPRSFTVVVTPKAPLSLADIAAASQNGPPIQLLPQLDFAVSAND